MGIWRPLDPLNSTRGEEVEGAEARVSDDVVHL